MIEEGMKLIVDYEYMTDKDLAYIIRRVNDEFNKELMKRLEWESTEYGKNKTKLHVPIELQEIKTGKSVSLDFIPNIDLILTYLALRFGETIVREFFEVTEKELREILRRSIKKMIMKFRKRGRKDYLEDFSYQ